MAKHVTAGWARVCGGEGAGYSLCVVGHTVLGGKAVREARIGRRDVAGGEGRREKKRKDKEERRDGAGSSGGTEGEGAVLWRVESTYGARW